MDITNYTRQELATLTGQTLVALDQRITICQQTNSSGCKYKNGAVSGKFRLIHMAHKEILIQAAGLCEHLDIFITQSTSTRYHLTTVEQKRIIASILADIDFKNYHLHIISDDNLTTLMWDQLLLKHNPQLQVIFNSKEDYSNILLRNEMLNINYQLNGLPLSVSEIEKDLYKTENYNMLTQQTKVYLNKKVTIIGSESCGKTTLTKKLASLFNTVWSEEYGKYHSDIYFGHENTAYVPSDFIHIVSEQMLQDKKQNLKANRILFVDTDPLTTLYYFYYVFATFSPQWLDTPEYAIAQNVLIEAVSNYKTDLHILLQATVPHIEDNYRWSDESTKVQAAAAYKQLASKHNINFIEIDATIYNDRLLETMQIIEQKLLITR
ncbi:MAG: AAA family ATPase [Culicoidibacterales bacterium]